MLPSRSGRVLIESEAAKAVVRNLRKRGLAHLDEYLRRGVGAHRINQTDVGARTDHQPRIGGGEGVASMTPSTPDATTCLDLPSIVFPTRVEQDRPPMARMLPGLFPIGLPPARQPRRSPRSSHS